VWAYCLMPNHVHLILTPQGADGMSRALGEAHRRYTNFINARGRWTGHLFQSRFASVAMEICGQTGLELCWRCQTRHHFSEVFVLRIVDTA
jgi:REP element-mobilizing transposase RayT